MMSRTRWGEAEFVDDDEVELGKAFEEFSVFGCGGNAQFLD